MDKEVILTKEGLKKLEEELTHLETTKRKEVADRIKEAIAFGDLSENSEFEDAKNEQAFIEGRISEIIDTLNHATIAKKTRSATEVGIGSWVVIKDLEDNEEVEYKVVGSAEANPSEHKISYESPVGVAIMDKKAGEKVQVAAPRGMTDYEIISVSTKSQAKSK